MVFGNSEETCYTYCETCGVKVEIGKNITKYGPDQITWFDGTLKDKAHTFCGDCYIKET